jgi:hypothetical protein
MPNRRIFIVTFLSAATRCWGRRAAEERTRSPVPVTADDLGSVFRPGGEDVTSGRLARLATEARARALRLAGGAPT